MMKRKMISAAISALGVISAMPSHAADADIDALKQELADQRKLIDQLLANQNRAPQVPTQASDVEKRLQDKDKGALNSPAPTTASASTPPPVKFYGVADVSVALANSGYGSKPRIEGGGGKAASRLGVQITKAFENVKVTAVAEAGVLFDTGGVGSAGAATGINDASPSSAATLGNGPQIFGRQMWAGVDAGFGQISIGRQYTGSYLAAAVVGSAWGDGFYGDTALVAPLIGGMPTRVNNGVIWSTPEVAHTRGIFTYTTGSENNVGHDTVAGTTTTNSRAGQGFDLAGIYADSGLQIAATTWNVHAASWVTAGETGLATKRGVQLAANYDFGFFKLVADFVHGTIQGGNYQNVTKTLSSGNSYATSVLIPFGKSKVELTATHLDDRSSLDRDGTAYGVNYWYDYSTDTSFYVSAGKMVNNRNATYVLNDAANLVGNASRPGFRPTGLEAGMNFKF